jgi:uncharacterized protein (TIGR02145 family)
MIRMRSDAAVFGVLVILGISTVGRAEQVPSKRMADGKLWTTRNLDSPVSPSFCYDDNPQQCREYGRLYTWDSARQACKALGDGWRLPTNDEWRSLAKHYGGIREESEEGGRATFRALMSGGSSGFEARLGGGRTPEETYARGGAHGFYWTGTESDEATAWFYNFGKNAGFLNRHRDGEKRRAFSVRCVRD